MIKPQIEDYDLNLVLDVLEKMPKHPFHGTLDRKGNEAFILALASDLVNSENSYIATGAIALTRSHGGAIVKITFSPFFVNQLARGRYN